MSVAAITDQFARREAGAPEPAAVAQLRRAALDRFHELGLPGRSLETWHYTDLAALADRAFDYTAKAPDPSGIDAAAAALDSLGLDPDAPRWVFLDGHWIAALSSAHDAANFSLTMLSDSSAELLVADPTEPADRTEPALAALNTAFASAGARIRVSGLAPRPIQLVFIAGRPGTAAQLRLRFELEPKARATAIQHFVALDAAGETWLNLVTDIDQNPGSELAVYRLQQGGPDQVLTALIRARLADDASFSAASIELGGGLVRNELDIALAGPGAAVQVQGLALTRHRQHCDTRIAVDHRAPETRSRQDYRAIAADKSRSVFNGKVTVQPGAQHIDARQRNDNLLLSAGAEIDTKPELEIYADQVICSHGATVGELSDEHLFYLRSRGIDAVTARAILTRAFADVILDRLGHDDFRERARAAVDRRLPQPADLG